jgi:hypothetical protein
MAINSVPRIDTYALYSRLTNARATGRIRLIEFPEVVNRNPYEIPIPSRPQVVLDAPCAAIKLLDAGKGGDRPVSGYTEAKVYRCMINRLSSPDILRIGLFAVINWQESIIKGVLDRIDPKGVSERFHLFIDAAQNVPFDPVNLGG